MDKKERDMQEALGTYIPKTCDVCGEKFEKDNIIWKALNIKTIYTHTTCYIYGSEVADDHIEWDEYITSYNVKRKKE